MIECPVHSAPSAVLAVAVAPVHGVRRLAGEATREKRRRAGTLRRSRAGSSGC